MSFKYDIFISYAQEAENNSQVTMDWTLKFCDLLSLIMKRLYHKEPVILSHDDLRTRKKLLDETSRDIFSGTAVFVIMLSPENIQSKEYLEELEEIYRAVASANQERNISQHRILKVFTKPVPLETQPEFLRSELNYNFFEVNRYNKKPVTFDLVKEEGPEQKCWSKLVDLAYDISNTLARLDPDKSGSGRTEKKPGIFLAETTFDQDENRDMLKRELQHLGFDILPVIPIPEESDQAKNVILENLQQSILSVHLLGGWYGDFLKNSKYSMIDFQIQTIKEYIKGKTRPVKLQQVIWIPNDLKATDQRQALYLKRLKRDESQYQTEIIETSFEVFKTALQVKLNEIQHPVPNPEAAKNKLYLIYEQAIAEKIDDYIDMIRSKGFELLQPHHHKSEFYSLSEHIDLLLAADAVMIYKGDSTMDWLNSKIRDLVKTPGYGKKKPFKAVKIISPQKTADKSLLFLKNIPVTWDDELNENVVDHFLEQLVKK